MKRIIIPTDFTTESRMTLDHVLQYSRETTVATDILLLNTFIVQETDPKLVIHLNDQLKKDSKTNLELLRLETIKKISNPLITVTTASHLGTLKNVILQILKHDKIDHVAVSRKLAMDLKTITDKLREMNCSIIVH